MCRLNTPGSMVAEKGLVKCATDVTGFGLLGHLKSLCSSSAVAAELNAVDVPLIDEEIVRLIEEEECVPGGTRENLRGVADFLEWSDDVSEAMKFVLADAQTSGGLLMCVAEENLEAVMTVIDEAETLSRSVIGRIVEADPSKQSLISIR